LERPKQGADLPPEDAQEDKEQGPQGKQIRIKELDPPGIHI
jgi:hypothetical protein